MTIEAGRTSGWYKYVSHAALTVGIDRFGASAPYEALQREFGFTPDAVVQRILDWRVGMKDE